jgi:hypothetical protein
MKRGVSANRNARCAEVANMQCREVNRYRTGVVLGKRYNTCTGFQGGCTRIESRDVVQFVCFGPKVGRFDVKHVKNERIE